MKRNYKDGVTDNVTFFTGIEIEHTPAFGLRTLFVTGIPTTEEIQDWVDDFASYEDKSKHIKHIFFGANHSFHPENNLEWQRWETMITYFLDKEYLCSLDIPMSAVEEFNDGGLNDYNNFIPQIRVPIPYVKLWNYNTMIKIDDKDFNATNPGVWTHSLHELKTRDKFTPWSAYANDTIIS
jgi:hypothetical protein